MAYATSFTRRLESVAFWIAVTTVVIAPLPFGSNTPETTAALFGLSGLSAFAFALSRAASPSPGELPRTRSLTLAVAAFAIVLLWAAVQSIPDIPGGLAHPLWDESATIIGTRPGAGSISIDPELTWLAIAKTAGYFAIGGSMLFLLRDPSRRKLACNMFIIAGLLFATYGLAELAGGDCCVLWVHKKMYLGVVTGPFVNRNNFATYLGLVMLVCLGQILRDLGELRNLVAPTLVARISARMKLLAKRSWLPLIALPLLAAAQLLTLSRAGILSTVLAAATLVFLASRAGILGVRHQLAHTGAFVVAAALIITVFGGALLNRFATEGVEDVDRTQSWQIVMSGIETSPWLGHGFGTFPEAFPLYRDDRLASRRYWDKAQNTYLELALDLGVPATLIFLSGFAAVAVQCLRGLRRRRVARRIYPAIGVAATVLVAAHSLVDFPMQIPAIATTYAFLMSLALTESGVWRTPASSSRGQDPDNRAETASAALSS